MNKLIFLLPILLSVLCQAVAQEKPHRENWRLDGPVLSMRIEKIVLENDGKKEKQTDLLEEVAFDDKGNLTFSEFYHPALSRRYANKLVNTYDENGRLSQTIIYEKDGALNRYELFSYDAKGRKTKKAWRRGENDVFSETLYFYNSSGELEQEKSRFRFVDWSESSISYEYDEKGRRREVTSNHPSPAQSSRVTYEYDESPNPAVMTIYDFEGNVKVRWEYRYDEQGREVETRVYGSNSNLLRHSTMTYETDAHGNWVSLKIVRKVFENELTKIEQERQRRTITYHQTSK